MNRVIFIRFVLPMLLILVVSGVGLYLLLRYWKSMTAGRLGVERVHPLDDEELILVDPKHPSYDEVTKRCFYAKLYSYPCDIIVSLRKNESEAQPFQIISLGHLRNRIDHIVLTPVLARLIRATIKQRSIVRPEFEVDGPDSADSLAEELDNLATQINYRPTGHDDNVAVQDSGKTEKTQNKIPIAG